MARWVASLGLRPQTAANAEEALATLRHAALRSGGDRRDDAWTQRAVAGRRAAPRPSAHGGGHRDGVHRPAGRRCPGTAGRRSPDQAVSARSLRAGGRSRTPVAEAGARGRRVARAADVRNAGSRRRDLRGGRGAGRGGRVGNGRLRRARRTRTCPTRRRTRSASRATRCRWLARWASNTALGAAIEAAARFHDIGKIAMPARAAHQAVAADARRDGDHAAARRRRRRHPRPHPHAARGGAGRARVARMVRRRRLSRAAWPAPPFRSPAASSPSSTPTTR